MRDAPPRSRLANLTLPIVVGGLIVFAAYAEGIAAAAHRVSVSALSSHPDVPAVGPWLFSCATVVGLWPAVGRVSQSVRRRRWDPAMAAAAAAVLLGATGHWLGAALVALVWSTAVALRQPAETARI